MDASLVVSVQQSDQRLRRLRASFSRAGLFVFLPVGLDAVESALSEAGSPALGAYLPRVSFAVLIGDGGRAFFEAFEEDRRLRRDLGPVANPLDDFTERRFAEILREGLGAGETWRVLFPFVDHQPVLSFQKLGCAAGLPVPGPLGLQIHPTYGPWWSFRGLALLSFYDAPIVPSPPSELPISDSCHACAKPCVHSCPVSATTRSGFQAGVCAQHRLFNARAGIALCATSCGARNSCPVGSEHQYTERQISFHMKASLTMIDSFARR